MLGPSDRVPFFTACVEATKSWADAADSIRSSWSEAWITEEKARRLQSKHQDLKIEPADYPVLDGIDLPDSVKSILIENGGATEEHIRLLRTTVWKIFLVLTFGKMMSLEHAVTLTMLSVCEVLEIEKPQPSEIAEAVVAAKVDSIDNHRSDDSGGITPQERLVDSWKRMRNRIEDDDEVSFYRPSNQAPLISSREELQLRVQDEFSILEVFLQEESDKTPNDDALGIRARALKRFFARDLPDQVLPPFPPHPRKPSDS